MVRRYRAGLWLGYGLLGALLVTGLLLVITRRPAGAPVRLLAPPTPLPLRVDVTGAVVATGVYALPPGSIVQDALTAAGGTTAQANLSTLNLAHRLQDGDEVLVPEMAPTTVAATAALPAGSPRPPAAGQINLNSASLSELENLPHVGPALAQRIIDYRTAHGPFRALEDVMLVSGIGPAIFEQIKALITI